MKRRAITDKMKWQSLLYWGRHICPECKEVVSHGAEIEWDHRHALVHLGPHEPQNIRAIHASCHKLKTARDIKANAKVKRIAKGGKTVRHPMKKGRGFQKKPEGYQHRWGRRPLQSPAR